jgi:hypothetical protein
MRRKLLMLFSVLAFGIAVATLSSFDADANEKPSATAGDDYQVIDLTGPNWEQDFADALTRTGYSDVPGAIERARVAKQRSQAGARPQYVSLAPLLPGPGQTDNMASDTYVNCGYSQEACVPQLLTGPSQGYGFWSGTTWPFGLTFVNPTLYISCGTEACGGIARYQYLLRAPKTWSLTWDGLFETYAYWCD